MVVRFPKLMLNCILFYQVYAEVCFLPKSDRTFLFQIATSCAVCRVPCAIKIERASDFFADEFQKGLKAA